MKKILTQCLLFGRVRKIAKRDYQLRHVRPSVRLTAWNNSAPTGRIFTKFDIWVFFEKTVENIQVGLSLKSDKNKGYFTWRPIYTCIYIYIYIISRSVLLRMRNVSHKCCRGNQNTYFVFSIFFFSKIQPFYEITWKNRVERDRPQMTIWLLRISCRIPKATHIHSQYVILIACPLQQWLHERASMLRYTYIACLVKNHLKILYMCLESFSIFYTRSHSYRLTFKQLR